MALYQLYSCNLEVKYKSYFLSKAMFFTLFTTVLNIILPFFIAYRGRGFWLRSGSFFEKPSVQFSYDYILVVETEDPSNPILCGNFGSVSDNGEEYCADFEVQENNCKDETSTCMMDFKFNIYIPPNRSVTSVIIILGLDYQLKTVCPLHMQSLAVISKEFSVPPSGFMYYGDLQLHQVENLPCPKYKINNNYNESLITKYVGEQNNNIVDDIMKKYFYRKVTTQLKTIHSRSLIGHTGFMDLQFHIRVPEMEIHYMPSLLQELKWAWPQYLSLVVVFYWIINRIKRFVFNNRLLLAWEIMPWKK